MDKGVVWQGCAVRETSHDWPEREVAAHLPCLGPERRDRVIVAWGEGVGVLAVQAEARAQCLCKW